MAKVFLCLKQGNVKATKRIHKYVDCRRQQRHRFQLKVHDYPYMCSPCLHTGLSTWAHLYLKATTFVVIRAIYIMNKKNAILSKSHRVPFQTIRWRAEDVAEYDWMGGDWIELFAQLRAHLGGLCQPICEYKLVVKVTFSFQFNLFLQLYNLNINRKDFLMCFWPLLRVSVN